MNRKAFEQEIAAIADRLTNLGRKISRVSTSIEREARWLRNGAGKFPVFWNWEATIYFSDQTANGYVAGEGSTPEIAIMFLRVNIAQEISNFTPDLSDEEQMLLAEMEAEV